MNFHTEDLQILGATDQCLSVRANLRPEFVHPLSNDHGQGSSVDIATGYWLDGPGIESQWGARFSVPVQTGPGTTHPPVQWIPGLSRGVKSGQGVTLTPHLLLVPWS